MLSLIFWRSHMAATRVPRHWRILDRFAELDGGAARAELGRRLLAQIRHFGRREDALPEWREAAKIHDIHDLWRIWSELPILTKQDLQTRFSPEEMRVRGKVRGIVSSTGGSTGEPTRFVHDAAMRRATNAVRLYARHRMGWMPGMPLICVWGSERDIGREYRLKSRIGSWFRNRWLVDGYRLEHQTVERVLMLIRRHRAVAIYGFSSMLEFVAREILQRGDLPSAARVRAAWNGGEMLLDSQVDTFRKAFGTTLLNCYGGRELSTMAFQPRPGASLTVLRPFAHVDVVDDEGKPVAPGHVGRLVWTSTVCRGTPFLRYDVGDLGVASAADQDESGVLRLTSLEGRYAGLLRLPGGRTINNIYWNHLFKEMPEVAQFQVVLRASRGIELRLKGRPFTVERENELRSILRNLLGPIPVSIAWMDHIPLTKQGKLEQVIREAA